MTVVGVLGLAGPASAVRGERTRAPRVTAPVRGVRRVPKAFADLRASRPMRALARWGLKGGELANRAAGSLTFLALTDLTALLNYWHPIVPIDAHNFLLSVLTINLSTFLVRAARRSDLARALRDEEARERVKKDLEIDEETLRRLDAAESIAKALQLGQLQLKTGQDELRQMLLSLGAKAPTSEAPPAEKTPSETAPSETP